MITQSNPSRPTSEGGYFELFQDLSGVIPGERLIRDDLRTLAYGTDASFYRLIPKLVVRVDTEAEVGEVLRHCNARRLPLTFRAGGTSLSGQSLSDSVLMQLGTGWRGIRVEDQGRLITLQPGVVGAHANARLAPYRRKIGPDPASINAAMVGGIAANNASGMCCGTSQNSYRTLQGMRIILADGTRLDTRSSASRDGFRQTRPDLVERIGRLAERTRENRELAARIRRKFKMKNTTGYSLNALIDFDDPIEVIQHLMIGSEGTLGFIAEITYRTVPDHPHKATALILFPDIKTACEATTLLRNCPVSAVEIMDRASLRSVEHKPGLPLDLVNLDPSVAALLVETRGETQEELDQHLGPTTRSLTELSTVEPVAFTRDPSEQLRLWNIRKGLFPSIGAIREIGTTVIIEDVAFPVDRLAEATLQLQQLFQKHRYSEAIIFGHALEGNLHFVFTQDFNRPEEVRRYRDFIGDLTQMVVHTYDGSLKAEHGTGRNMAPFVELEWGAEAYRLMREIKSIFDPGNLLNPGVILNSDPQIHLKNLKPLPRAHSVVDKCTECGFCEVNCPSRDLTLTPRQRIAVWREISRLRSGGDDPSRLIELTAHYAYQGDATCATDGLCAISCPVGIDTGKLIKDLRRLQVSGWQDRAATLLARHLGLATASLRLLLDATHGLHLLLGSDRMQRVADWSRRLSGNRLPRWNPCLPRAAEAMAPSPAGGARLKAVYFPSCLSRTLGVGGHAPGQPSQNRKMESLMRKAGVEPVYPENLANLCCGMPFASKGFERQGASKQEELHRALRLASRDGLYPVLVDTSPCLFRLKESSLFDPGFPIYEPAQFILKVLRPGLTFSKSTRPVALHSPCSSRKMGLDSPLRQLAELCAEAVIVPDSVGCCGFAGDRGFSHPELTESALAPLRASLPSSCARGYSTSKTCEIGLSLHARIPYQSIAYLVDECTEGRGRPVGREDSEGG